MNEFTRIATFFAPLAAKAEGAFGLTDDAACITPPEGEHLVVTQDTLVEGIHFRGDEEPALIARKALRVNLSDLAAKGASPLAYFLSLSLPERCDEHWLASFTSGLAQDQREYGITLMGGDSTGSRQGVVITITAIGTTPRMVLRSGAQAGDLIAVTGTIGDGALGLAIAEGKAAYDAWPLGRYLVPQPRVAFARVLRDHASGAMDISDGLLQDATHLARASGVSLALRLEDVPLSAAARAHAPDVPRLLELLAGGDDYELLFTFPPASGEALRKAAEAAGISLRVIGQCAAEGAPLSLTHQGETLALPEKLGYLHSR